MAQAHRVSTPLIKRLIDFTEQDNPNSVHWADFFAAMRSSTCSAFFYMIREPSHMLARKLLNTWKEGDQQLSVQRYDNVVCYPQVSLAYRHQKLSSAGTSTLSPGSGVLSLRGYPKLLSPVGSGLYRLAVSGALATLVQLERAVGWLKASNTYALLLSDSPAVDDTTVPADMVQRIHHEPNFPKENHSPPKKVSITWVSIEASLCGAGGLVIEPKVTLAASCQHLADMT